MEIEIESTGPASKGMDGRLTGEANNGRRPEWDALLGVKIQFSNSRKGPTI